MKRKKIILLLALTVMFAITTTTYAWHLECSFGGDMDNMDPGSPFGGNMGDMGNDDLSMWLQSDCWAMNGAGWWAEDASEDPDTGEILVSYDCWDGMEDWGNDGSIWFEIKSDYGNSNQVPVDVYVQMDAEAYGTTQKSGHYETLGVGGLANVAIWNDYGGYEFDLQVYGDESNLLCEDFAESLTLMANTPYQVSACVEAVVEVWIMDMPPSRFDSWADYNAYFGGTMSGDVIRDTSGYLDYELTITSDEIPLPATAWLLGAGTLVLTRRRKLRRS